MKVDQKKAEAFAKGFLGNNTYQKMLEERKAKEKKPETQADNKKSKSWWQ
jgi:hypothetical protein